MAGSSSVATAEIERWLSDMAREQSTLGVAGRACSMPRPALALPMESGRCRCQLAGFRDALGISRRAAQLLLERFDADGITRRVGDERVLRRAASRG